MSIIITRNPDGSYQEGHRWLLSRRESQGAARTDAFPPINVTVAACGQRWSAEDGLKILHCVGIFDQHALQEVDPQRRARDTDRNRRGIDVDLERNTEVTMDTKHGMHDKINASVPNIERRQFPRRNWAFCSKRLCFAG